MSKENKNKIFEGKKQEEEFIKNEFFSELK